MGGSGNGASPETLLMSAVTACYCLTLLAILRKKELPVTELRVATEGIVSGHPRALKYEKVIVSPVFAGGDPARRDQYSGAAVEAHDTCFIGQTVAAAGVSYEVGSVDVA
jgi:organic hydroperoxide reductase OsmC/OhrA